MPADGDRPSARLEGDRALLRERVGRADRLGARSARRPERGHAAAADAPETTASSGSGTPMTPVDATTTSSRRAAERRARRRPPSPRHRDRPRAPVHAFALPALTTAARATPPARCSRDTTTGAAATVFVVKTAAAGTARSGVEERDVEAAVRLEARRDAGRGESGRRGDATFRRLAQSDMRGLAALRPPPGTRRARRSRSRPSAMLAHWTACPPEPFTRLSIAQATTSMPAAASTARPRCARFVPRHLVRSTASTRAVHRDERLRRVARAVGLDAPRPS